MPISDWLDMMPDTVQIKLCIGYNAFGEPILQDSATSYRARVSYKQRRVTSRVSGLEVISSGEVWVNGILSDLTADAEITLPDDSKPIIVNWDISTDEVGTHHTKIILGGSR